MYLVNFLDSISSSDTIFCVLMILLTIISVILFFLIYTQNKESSRKMKEKSLFEDEEPVKLEKTKNTVTEVENLIAEKPDLVPVTDMEIPDFLELTQSFYVVPEPVVAPPLVEETKVIEPIKEVEPVKEAEPVKEVEIVKEVEPVKEVQLEVVKVETEEKDLSISEKEELQSITRELETIPRERKIEMTPYEAEQEETAIISYDELLKYNDKQEKVEIKKPVSSKKTFPLFEKVKKENVDEIVSSYVKEPIKDEPVVEASNVKDENIFDNNQYEHEEKFLGGLKTLLNMLKN